MRALTAFLVTTALASSLVLLVADGWSGFRDGDARRIVSAIPLIAIAFACLLVHAVWEREPLGLLKRVLLSAAFLFWAANQLFPSADWAPIANDIAIALFVLDLALLIRDEVKRRVANNAPSRTLVQRVHNPRNRHCYCDPDCWCRRTALGRAVKWWLPARYIGLHHKSQYTVAWE